MKRALLFVLATAPIWCANSGLLNANPCIEFPTLPELIDRSSVTATVKSVGEFPGDPIHGIPAFTIYEVVDVIRDEGDQLKPGSKLALESYRPSIFDLISFEPPGQTDIDAKLLLLGYREKSLQWVRPISISSALGEFLRKIPERETGPEVRLIYFMQYLDNQDRLIAEYANLECADATLEDLASTAKLLDPRQVRNAISSKQNSYLRLRLYCLLLGFCGGTDDVEFLRQQIIEPAEDYRENIQLLMIGYLMLSGSEGVDFLEDAKLVNPHATARETYAAQWAIEFMWTDFPNHIENDHLRAAMRTLIDRPEIFEMVIAKLADWEDWSVQDRLVELWDKEGYDSPAAHRAIVHYILAAATRPPNATTEVPEHVAKAREILKVLHKKDPQLIEQLDPIFSLRAR